MRRRYAALFNGGTTKQKSREQMMQVRPILFAAALAAFAAPAAAEPDWSKVDAIFGRAPMKSDNAVRYGFPRSDLNVTLDGIAIKPGFALGGWVAFAPMGDSAMAMGDLVLTESEINPVMAKLLSEGVEITAVHNHLLRATPATFYMHIEGHGDPAKLAEKIRAGLALSKTPMQSAAPASPPPPLELDTAKLDETIGVKGRANGPVYGFNVPRADQVKESGMVVPAALGSAIAINFQPTGGGKAAITGDFVALASEVNPLITALRQHGIEVTAIHNHMLNDEPRMFFIHFWANDDAQKLANGLRLALDTMNVKTKGSKSQ
jgi:Domain of Unknown Function (DUF1259)